MQTEPTPKPEKQPDQTTDLEGVASTDLLASYVLVCNAAAEMADRLKTLMEMHSRLSAMPEHMACMGSYGIQNQGRSAHWWMGKLSEYFNATDAVDPDSPMDQSWELALDAARKFFPLANAQILP